MPKSNVGRLAGWNVKGYILTEYTESTEAFFTPPPNSCFLVFGGGRRGYGGVHLLPFVTFRKEQVDEQGGGCGLPSAIELRREGNGEAAACIPLDGDGLAFDAGEQVKAAALQKVFEEGAEDGLPGAVDLPAVVPLVAGLPGGFGHGKAVPGEAGGELEEDDLEQQAMVERGPAAERARRSLQPGGGGEEGLEEGPLGIGEEHGNQVIR